MPPKQTFWNNEGILKQNIKSGWFVSNLTSEIEVIYVNMDPRT